MNKEIKITPNGIKQAIENLLNENEQLLKENQELKSELETYNKGCSELRKIIEHKDEKIKELEKQLEEKIKIGVADHKYASKCEDKVITMENQQKEFIEYINEKIDICDGFIDTIRSDLEEISYGGRSCGKQYIANEIMKNEVAKKILEEILSKYKEITGQQGGQVDNQVGSQV